MAFTIDWSKVDGDRPGDRCPEEGCDHRVDGVWFTPRHRWDLRCSAGAWWRGCGDTGLHEDNPSRCACPGCKPRQDAHTRRLTARLARRKCRCDPVRARAEAQDRQERREQDDRPGHDDDQRAGQGS